MDRRAFLKLFGLATATTAAGLVVPELLLPPRRFWQVSRNAPFPAPKTLEHYLGEIYLSGEHGHVYETAGEFAFTDANAEAMDRYIKALARNAGRSFQQRIESAMFFGEPSRSNEPFALWDSLSLNHA